jgi:HD-GYP domain-containing protein (c-di-GMP phosphodiesterase class II)
VKVSKLAKTNFVIALILFSGFAAIAILYFYEFNGDAMRRMQYESELEISSIYARLSSLFIQEVSVSTSMANDGFLISYLSDSTSYDSAEFETVIKNYLLGCMRTYGFDAAFLSLTQNNALYSQKGFDRILSDDMASAWYNAALAHSRDYDINIDTDKFANEEISIFVNCKIRGREGNLLGIIGVCIHTDSIVAAIKDFEQTTGAKAKLVGEDGTIEISSERKGLDRLNWFSLTGNESFRKEFETAKKRHELSASIDFAGMNTEVGSYISAQFLPELSWFLIVEHPTGDFFSSLRRSAVRTALVFIAVLLVALIVIARVVHGFEREINRMADERQRNLAAMRDAMILTLADMVEGRDLNTGQHIRKTAAYVRIIMNELQREGAFGGRITTAYIESVVRSAPLHDIGKINIPDAILNKPGKLTDEEFEIMKSHAAVGGKVIGHIIDIVPDSDYLVEAKALATYHHEKWNGGGYPEGLAGESIPLSARIMAVADVFDALVSDRAYKKGFPLEKAFAIIREERGTHFDPRIVDAFFMAKESIIQVEEEFRQAGAVRPGASRPGAA